MFYIGAWDKQKIITHYLEHNPSVNGVVIFYREGLQREYDIPIKCEYLEYKQSIMYKNYYRLLEHVNRNTLVIIDECLGTINRHCLEYNCMKTIINQTPQRLVFNYLPFIENTDDFMILMEFYNETQYKSEKFVWDFLKDINLHVKPVHIHMDFDKIEMSEESIQKYEREKKKLFDNIGNSDPDTIPRNLALTAGNLRYENMGKGRQFLVENSLVRNKRFKKGLVYKEEIQSGAHCEEDAMIFDFPMNRIHLIDVLTTQLINHIYVFTSDLSIDKWHRQDYEAWVERLEEFYRKFEEMKK